MMDRELAAIHDFNEPTNVAARQFCFVFEGQVKHLRQCGIDTGAVVGIINRLQEEAKRAFCDAINDHFADQHQPGEAA